MSSSLATSAEVIDYVGSSTIGKFMTEASTVYTKADFTINTRPESGGGESRVATGKASLGGVARELSPECDPTCGSRVDRRKPPVSHRPIRPAVQDSHAELLVPRGVRVEEQHSRIQ